jgi:hypothetical protein
MVISLRANLTPIPGGVGQKVLTERLAEALARGGAASRWARRDSPPKFDYQSKLCEADVTSVVVRNGRRSGDVFEIDPSGSTREAAASAVRNNLVLASAANL